MAAFEPQTRAQLQEKAKQPINVAQDILQDIYVGVDSAARQGKTIYIHKLIKYDFTLFQELLGEDSVEFLFPDSVVMYIETKTNGGVNRTIKIDWS